MVSCPRDDIESKSTIQSKCIQELSTSTPSPPVDSTTTVPTPAGRPISSPIIVSPEPGVSFVVRPFPPPNLVGVPIDYVVAQLRKLAPHYWAKNETADCTIIVPFVDQNRSRGRRRSEGPFPVFQKPRDAGDEALSSGPFANIPPRRSSAPTSGPARREIVKLHRDYLSSQSSFFRSLFSGLSPLDLANPLNPQPSSRLAAGAFPVPTSARPRLLPCAPNHPQLYLPLPDPTSFRHIIHYLYFGSMSTIEDALIRKEITWEGIVRNVEYLGLRSDIKIFLGKWWGNWLDPNRNNHRENLVARQTLLEEDSDGDDGDTESDIIVNTRTNSPRSKLLIKRRSRSREKIPLALI